MEKMKMDRKTGIINSLFTIMKKKLSSRAENGGGRILLVLKFFNCHA
jgi:hypothetical protein